MSSVIAAPELMEVAAGDLAAIGSTVSAAHLAVAAPTIAVTPAAADEVSAGIAHLFSGYAQDYQALAGRAAAFHDQFVQHITAGAGSYAATEAAAASSLRLPVAAASIDPNLGAVVGSLERIVNSLIAAIEPQLPTIFALFEIAIIAIAAVAALIILAPLLPALIPVLAPFLLLLVSTGKL